MGCSASSPEAVINDNTTTSVQNAAGDTSKGPASLKYKGTVFSLPKIEKIEEEARDSSPNESKSVAKEEEKTIVGTPEDKYEAQDTNPRCNELEIPVAKPGYVAYEVNLDGELTKTLNNLKKKLPERLKRLEPLLGAPKLTAEELNESLEQAERQHRRALAMKKNVIIRRFKKSNNQTGDISDSVPNNNLSADNEASSSTDSAKEGKSNKETLNGSQISEATHQAVDSVVVDLSKINNTATERREGLEKLCQGHLLHAVTEVAEDAE